MINLEAQNTRKMREHQLNHKRQENALGNFHEEVNLGCETTVINFATSVALNAQSDKATLADIVQENPENWCLVSDADPQLLFRIVFKDPTTVTALSFKAVFPPEDVKGCAPPSEIRIYSNKDDLDFTDIEETVPAQVAQLKCPKNRQTAEDVEEEVVENMIYLKGAKFQRISSIQIFIADNQDPQNCLYTYLNGLVLKGFVCPPYTQQHNKKSVR